ncbi:hypothetical protein B0H14DRAFT_3523808 [Mycena olivaceomarginata]|nr:hypothetical protein B0H14DRAFT_3523808 [Mycena olivaceomarginata]
MLERACFDDPFDDDILFGRDGLDLPLQAAVPFNFDLNLFDPSLLMFNPNTSHVGTSRLATCSLATSRLATRSLATSRLTTHSLGTSHLGTNHLVTSPPRQLLQSRDQRGRERVQRERVEKERMAKEQTRDEGEGPADGNEEERVGAGTWEGQDMTAWQAEMRGTFEAFTEPGIFPTKGLLSAPNGGPEERPKEVPDFMPL